STPQIGSQCGQDVVFVTVVSPAPPATGAPTGTVTYTDLTTGQTLVIQGLTTAQGVQQNAFVTSTLTPGNHTIQATYNGDANFSGSSATHDIIIAKCQTTTMLVSSLNPSLTGQSVTFTANVSANDPSQGTPTGSVTFIDATTSQTLST